VRRSANLQLLLQVADARRKKHLAFVSRLQLGHGSSILPLETFKNVLVIASGRSSGWRCCLLLRVAQLLLGSVKEFKQKSG
jgi:hypothetical protein